MIYQAVPRTLCASLLTALCCATACAQSSTALDQTLRQDPRGTSLTTVRINWDGTPDEDNRGHGLKAQAKQLWTPWENRIGLVIDNPTLVGGDDFALSMPASSGLRLHSLHILSDYYLDGGFRATAGLLSGDTSQPWWAGGISGGGLNLSLQRLSPSGTTTADSSKQTSSYIGAGYSTRLNSQGLISPWRFNADLGLISINSNNINRITDILQGDRNFGDIVRDLRFRPVVKVSVRYAF
jgi:hypothetical protein